MDVTVYDTVPFLEPGAQPSLLCQVYTATILQQNSLIVLFLISGTNEPSKLFERPPWQKLVLIFLAELIGTAVLMLFGCLGVVSTSADRGLGPYSGPISFSCTVAVLIVVSIFIIIIIMVYTRIIIYYSCSRVIPIYLI